MGDKEAARALTTLRRRATFAAGIGLQPVNEGSAAGFHSAGFGDISSDHGPEKKRDRSLEAVQSNSKSEKKKRRADTALSDTLR